MLQALDLLSGRQAFYPASRPSRNSCALPAWHGETSESRGLETSLGTSGSRCESPLGRPIFLCPLLLWAAGGGPHVVRRNDFWTRHYCLHAVAIDHCTLHVVPPLHNGPKVLENERRLSLSSFGSPSRSRGGQSFSGNREPQLSCHSAATLSISCALHGLRVGIAHRWRSQQTESFRADRVKW